MFATAGHMRIKLFQARTVVREATTGQYHTVFGLNLAHAAIGGFDL